MKKKLLMTSLALLLIALIIYPILMGNKDSDVANEDSISELSIHQKDSIKRAISEKLGSPGFPNSYKYPRPISIDGYDWMKDIWLIVDATLEDEVPTSYSRHAKYLFKKEGDKLTLIGSSVFTTQGEAPPANVPNEVIDNIVGGDW